MHPTDFILLPFLPNHNIEEGQQAPGDVWTTYATGGSGVYSWSITNPEIASVKGSATIRSL